MRASGGVVRAHRTRTVDLFLVAQSSNTEPLSTQTSRLSLMKKFGHWREGERQGHPPPYSAYSVNTFFKVELESRHRALKRGDVNSFISIKSYLLSIPLRLNFKY